MSFEKCIELFGESYLLLGDLKSGGPIATKEQYENFECSYAHLKPNGNIYRFNKIIGTKDDIKLSIIEIDVEPKCSMGKVLGAISNPVKWAM